MTNPLYTKARASLVLDQPFFGTLCLRLKPVETEDMPTGATDGVHLFYNPKWFEKQTPLERVGFLAHEVMHVVLMHHTRRQEREAERWNVAADYAINNHLVKEGFILPKGGLVDEQYDDMMSEHIYDQLPPQEYKLLDPGKCGGVLDHPDMDGTQGKANTIETQLTVAINQASEQAKAQGKLSGNLETLVNGVTQPKVDWKAVLARFLRANNKADFTWQKPNRRMIANGLYLPSMYNPCLEEVCIVCDTSGSRTDEELNQDLGEISYILRELNPERIHLIQCDYEVNKDEEYSRESLPLEVTFEGRGGTAFEPAFTYINEKYPHTAAVIYLTDLEASDFGDKPQYPVLWITNYSEEAPFGEIIKI